jgi:hypothetical protein
MAGPAKVKLLSLRAVPASGYQFPDANGALGAGFEPPPHRAAFERSRDWRANAQDKRS